MRHHLAALLASVPAVSVRLRKPVTVALAAAHVTALQKVTRDDDQRMMDWASLPMTCTPCVIAT